MENAPLLNNPQPAEVLQESTHLLKSNLDALQQVLPATHVLKHIEIPQNIREANDLVESHLRAPFRQRAVLDLVDFAADSLLCGWRDHQSLLQLQEPDWQFEAEAFVLERQPDRIEGRTSRIRTEVTQPNLRPYFQRVATQLGNGVNALESSRHMEVLRAQTQGDPRMSLLLDASMNVSNARLLAAQAAVATLNRAPSPRRDVMIR